VLLVLWKNLLADQINSAKNTPLAGLLQRSLRAPLLGAYPGQKRTSAHGRGIAPLSLGRTYAYAHT
jgi:hypothetical protein